MSSPHKDEDDLPLSENRSSQSYASLSGYECPSIPASEPDYDDDELGTPASERTSKKTPDHSSSNLTRQATAMSVEIKFQK